MDFFIPDQFYYMTFISVVSIEVIVIYSLKELGARLKRARGSLTQLEVAKELGVDRSYIGSIEQGRAKPSLNYLVYVAKRFGVSIDWILFGNEINISQKMVPPALAAAGEDEDAELDLMIAYLKELWHDHDCDRRGWLKIQFKEAFPKYLQYQQEKMKNR